MEDLQVAQGARQKAGDIDDITAEMARLRRHLATAARDTPRSGARPRDRAQAADGDRTAAASDRRKRHRRRKNQEPRTPLDPIVVTLLVGLAAEGVVPWAVIWLSARLFFVVPPRALWLIFGGPPALTFLAVLVEAAIRIQRWQRMGLTIRRWRHLPRRRADECDPRAS